MMARKIGVLIVEDSPSLQQLLIHIIESDARLEVKAVARNGEEAIALAMRMQPDVITMDILMPKMDGITAIRQIMSAHPAPILVITAASDADTSFAALQAGALEVVAKPAAINSAGGQAEIKRIVETIKLIAEVKVVKRRPSHSDPATVHKLRDARRAPKVIAIAASTGGPPVLREILKDLPASYPIPILIVQHIAEGFAPSLVSWLDSVITPSVRVASDGETPQGGNVYVAADDRHLLLCDNGRLKLSHSLPVNGHRPSADLLFESVAGCYGAATVGIILTGMGSDGVEGLKQLKARGGICIAQDQSSSVVYGMPRMAVEAGIVDRIMSPDECGLYLNSLERMSTGC